MMLLAAVCGPLRAEAQRVRVDFIPDQLLVAVGRTEEARILLSDARTGVDVDIGSLRDIRVRSQSPEVATVGRKENVLLVTGVAPGFARIEVSVSGRPKLLIVKVQAADAPAPATAALPGTAAPVTHPAPPAAVQVAAERTELHLLPGERARAIVYAVGPNGTRLPAVRFSYQSLDTSLVSVDSTGEVHGLAPGGPATVIATPPGGQSFPIRVTVESARLRIQPDSLLIYATWRDTLRLTAPSLGRDYRGPVTWTSSNPGALEVDPQTGVLGRINPVGAVTAVTIWARSPAGEMSSSIRIFPQEDSHLFVPEPGTTLVVPLGGSSTQVLRDGLALSAAKDTLFTLPLRWEVADTTVAVLDRQRRLLTARRQDTTSLKATVLIRRQDSQRVEYRWPVRVVGAGVATDRARVGLRVGMRDTLRLLMLDTLRHPMADSITGTWSVAQTGRVVHLEPDGTIEALGAGRAIVTGKSAWDSTVTVPVIVASDFYYVVRFRTPDDKVRSELRGVDLQTRSQRRITSTAGLEAAPAVSPDRTRIAFFRRPSGGSPDIYVADADGENVVNLTGDTLPESEPTWSHDGSKLFFLRQTTANGPSRLFVTAADGGSARLFLDLPYPIQSIAASPDGKHLVYSTVRNGQYDLYSVPLTTTGPLGPAGIESAWTLTPENETTPRFAGNGDLFFIQSGRKGNPAALTLMRMRAAVATPEPITSSAFQVLSFAVAPDGNRILFVGQPTTRDARKQGQALYYIDLNAPIPGEPLLVNDPQSDPLTPAFTP